MSRIKFDQQTAASAAPIVPAVTQTAAPVAPKAPAAPKCAGIGAGKHAARCFLTVHPARPQVVPDVVKGKKGFGGISGRPVCNACADELYVAQGVETVAGAYCRECGVVFVPADPRHQTCPTCHKAWQEAKRFENAAAAYEQIAAAMRATGELAVDNPPAALVDLKAALDSRNFERFSSEFARLEAWVAGSAQRKAAEAERAEWVKAAEAAKKARAVLAALQAKNPAIFESGELARKASLVASSRNGALVCTVVEEIVKLYNEMTAPKPAPKAPAAGAPTVPQEAWRGRGHTGRGQSSSRRRTPGAGSDARRRGEETGRRPEAYKRQGRRAERYAA